MLARWAKFSNKEPTKIDLSGGDMTSAARFVRPRPQDFDPDPKLRRAAVKYPPEITSDPRSAPNMLKALRAAGFNARPSVLGETDFVARADLLVDFPGGKEKGRFALLGGRRKNGLWAWRFGWEGRTRQTASGTDELFQANPTRFSSESSNKDSLTRSVSHSSGT